MTRTLEFQTGTESLETVQNDFEADFRVLKGVKIPDEINSKYSRLSETGRDSLLHAGIEESLSKLETKILGINTAVSLNLANALHG